MPVRRGRFDGTSFAAGIALAALGVLLELDAAGVLELGFEFAVPALLAAAGTALLTHGLARRR